jgi:hypothetical protein
LSGAALASSLIAESILRLWVARARPYAREALAAIQTLSSPEGWRDGEARPLDHSAPRALGNGDRTKHTRARSRIVARAHAHHPALAYFEAPSCPAAAGPSPCGGNWKLRQGDSCMSLERLTRRRPGIARIRGLLQSCRIHGLRHGARRSKSMNASPATTFRPDSGGAPA